MVACRSGRDYSAVEHPFYCHCENSHCSYSVCIRAGYVGCVNLFDILNEDIMGVGIEHAMKVGGSFVDNSCRINCIKTKTIWRPHRESVCCYRYNGRECRIVKPWVLCPDGDCYIELPAGIYRFCAYDCDYTPYVPGPQDILMKLLIKPAG